MPTAAKLVAGFLVAALGWYVAYRIVPYLPEETRIGLFREIMALFGLLIGWRFLGRRAGDGFVQSIGFGIGAAAFLVFWGLLWFSGVAMFKRAIRMSYGGDPFAAVKDMINIAVDYFPLLTPNDVWVTLVVGGMLAGFLTEAASKRWP